MKLHHYIFPLTIFPHLKLLLLLYNYCVIYKEIKMQSIVELVHACFNWSL